MKVMLRYSRGGAAGGLYAGLAVLAVLFLFKNSTGFAPTKEEVL